MTINTKIFWSFLCLSILPLLISSYFIHQYALEIIKKQELQSFRDKNIQVAEEFKIYIESFDSSIRFLSDVPPIQGIIRSKANSGIDPMDGSDVESWRKRLQSIFISYLELNQSIYQLRYLNSLGFEEVRVQRKNDQAIIIQNDELQDKSKTEYFVQSAYMREGDIYHSNIDLNREHGETEGPYVPVVRLAMPVFSADDKSFAGVVVINVLMEKIFHLLEANESQSEYIVIDELGQYLFSNDKTKMFSHLKAKVSQNYFTNDTLKHFIYNVQEESFYYEDEKKYIVKKVLFYARNAKNKYWVIIQELEEHVLWGRINAITNVVIITLLFSFLFVIVFVIFVSRSISAPLKNLTNIAKEILSGNLKVKFDSQSESKKDEVAILSKTIHLMTNKLIASNENLAVQVEEKTKDLHEKNKALENEKQKAIQAANAKSDFLANMSHEIRTPMNSILGFADLLMKTDLDHKQKGYLQTVQSSGNLLLGIIDDILDISKLESGKIILESKPFHLEDLVMDVFKMIVTRMKDKPFDTYIDVAENVPRYIVSDPTRLRQILVNLLGNAVKFTPSGSIGVIISMDESAKNIVFRVKDTGIGIAADKVCSIFESFTQADESTTRKFGGTGLGLTISKSLVSAMGGQISVESIEGQGSEFIFDIPFNSEKNIRPMDSEADAVTAIVGKKVFIIDDNQIAQKIINKCCESMGLSVIGLADSAPSALQKLDKILVEKNLTPDLILCDIMMHGMDGYEFTRKLRQSPSFDNVKCLAITADIKAEVSPQAKEELFDAYLTKPINTKELLYAMKGVLDQYKTDEVTSTIQGGCEGIKILVVEDVDANRMLIDVYFSEIGCEGDFAVNGQEAIEKIKVNSYDLVLMDLQMPVMGGIEATRIIRADINQKLPIIALTAAVLTSDRQEAEAVGMTSFLAKPIDVIKLKEMILKYGRAVKS